MTELKVIPGGRTRRREEYAMPCALPAERQVLGACLLEREAIIVIATWLQAAHFYLEKHAWIYEAILECYQRRVPPDIATVADQLQRRGRLELVGGFSELGELAAGVPTAYHVEYYARTVERTAVGRALIEAGGKIAALGYDDEREVEDRLDEAGQLIYDLSTQRQLGQDFVPIAKVADEWFAAVAAAPEAGDLLGLSTGYPDLDRITLGFKPGELILLAARPGVGKTSLMLSIAYHLAQAGYGVGIFSLEMDRELLLQRMLAAHINEDTTRLTRLLRSGDSRVLDGLAELHELPIYVDHTSALSALAIRDRARRLAANTPIACWMVDYVQLAYSDNDRDDDVRRVSAVSQGLMSLARDFRVPVLALSQLSRAVEGRQDKVPQLSDLRGSGSLEQDASQVWFIYREELYNKETDQKGVAEIHIAKHRNGPTGVVPLSFDARTTSFRPLERYRAPEGY